jgi:hypothetical protein
MVYTHLGRNVRFAIGVSLVFVSTLILGWGLWPAKQNQRLVNLPAINGSATDNGAQKLLEASQIRIIWPERLSVGDTGQVLVVLESGGGIETQPDFQAGGNEPVTLIEARLELTGILLAPEGVIQQSNHVDGPLEFRWQVRPVQSGVYPGTLWLHLIEAPTLAKGVEKRHLLSVQPLEIHAASLFGLSTYPAQVIGIIGLIAGAALCFDIFLRKK